MKHIALHLKSIGLKGQTGILSFQTSDIRKQFYFRDGFLVSANTNQEGEILGKILYKLGKLPLDAYSKIESFIQPGKYIGEALVAGGFITPDDLCDGLTFQIKEIILNVFPFFDAEMSFQPVDRLEKTQPEVTVPVSDLIIDGIRRMTFDPELQVFFRGRSVTSHSADIVDRLNVNEAEVLKEIGPGLSLDGISDPPLSDLEVKLKTLFLLFCLDLIRFIETTPEIPILEVHSRFLIMDYYQVLDIPRTATPAEAKEAYFRLTKIYHPDTFPRNLSGELKDKVDEIFDRINKAYHTISDEQKRQRYNSKAGDVPGIEKPDASSQAEALFRKGKQLYDSDRFEDALSFFSDAVKLWKNSARYFLFLGLTKIQIPIYSQKAESDLLEAIRLETWNPDNYVALGQLYKSHGLSVKASRQFEKALSLDPEHRVALKEMGKESRKKKGLNKIFKRSV